MSFDQLPIELVYHVLCMYGTSPEAFCRRWATRAVCKLFHQLVPRIAEKITFANWVTQNIHIDLQKHSPCQAYDIDDSMFVRIPGEQPGRGLLFKLQGMMGRRVLYHPFSEKFVISRFNIFWRSSSLDRIFTMPNLLVKHVKAPCYETKETCKAARLKRYFEERITMNVTTTMIKSLMSLHHPSVTKVSCKESSLTREGFDALAILLHKNANIGKLNISCHMNDGYSDSIISVLNVASLIHLNMGFCGCISINETCALIRLIMKKKLMTLKTIGTDIPWFEYFVAALPLSSLVDFTYTLPRDSCVTASYICHIHDFNSLKVYDDINMWPDSRNELELFQQLGNEWAYSTGCRNNYFSSFFFETKQSCTFYVDSFMSTNESTVGQTEQNKNITDEVPKVVLKLIQPSTYEASEIEDSSFASNVGCESFVKDGRQEMYDRRNKRRNEFIYTSKACKSCNTVWPAGSIKLQTFEGLQSMCRLGKRKCSLSIHYRTTFC